MVKGKRSTIKDVAERARVSTATVSFVLNDNPNETISAGVRRRVLEAARELSYHASAAAAGLARKRLGNVGLVFYEDQDAIRNHFYSFVVQGAVKEAIARGYNLLFSYVDAEYRGFQDLPKIVREKNTDGVLFMRRVLPKMVKDIARLGLPVVAVDPFPRVDAITMVEIDDRRGGALAAEHLLELGHEALSMLVPRSCAPSIEQRLAGFREALERRGLSFTRERRIDAPALAFEAAHEAMRRVLARRGAPTAVFAANDEMAAGALRAAREAGRGVPEDVSVVGFDDIVMSRYTDPPLTTIGVDKERMGRRAMARLIDLVEGAPAEPSVELVPVELVVRGSTAKPRAAAVSARRPRSR